MRHILDKFMLIHLSLLPVCASLLGRNYTLTMNLSSHIRIWHSSDISRWSPVCLGQTDRRNHLSLPRDEIILPGESNSLFNGYCHALVDKGMYWLFLNGVIRLHISTSPQSLRYVSFTAGRQLMTWLSSLRACSDFSIFLGCIGLVNAAAAKGASHSSQTRHFHESKQAFSWHVSMPSCILGGTYSHAWLCYWFYI